MSKVSVIVPVYNASRTVLASVASLQRQTISDLEIILVDDGSTDNSLALCREAADSDSRIHVFTQTNAGVSAARNLGLSYATGDYIGFLDSDDVAKPEMYAILSETMYSLDCQLVMGGYEKVIDDETISTITLPYHGLLTGRDALTDIAWSMAFWNGWRKKRHLPTLYGSTWPNLYRADIIHQHGIIYPHSVTIGEDLLFNLQYLKAIASVAFVNQPLYRYNCSSTSATRRTNPCLWEKYKEILVRVQEILGNTKEDTELELNIHRQVLAYAINVIEEQASLYHTQQEQRALIRHLCDDTSVKSSSRELLMHGNSFKERAWGLAFALKLTSFLGKKLTKGEKG